jgi:hypothetical protein
MAFESGRQVLLRVCVARHLYASIVATLNKGRDQIEELADLVQS